MLLALRVQALRWLAGREHTRAELVRKLAPQADSREELERLLDELSEQGLLSDARYAEARLNARRARYGDARLKRELHARGVSEALAQEALAVGEDETTRAHRLWQERFGGQSDAADAAERARQMRFLLRRGFSGETVRRVVRGDFEANEEE